ncbi:MAG: glycosyltransferase [Prevotellaceae bacterium]|jgi:glycosyltransferase involved in cell wall biosynthesis|nr:glycosyltransferase [Prevotellaceae bacterium]
MKFSIIIPVYNVEKYLAECLNSVISQTFADFEAICVNDGSTDGSPYILDSYAKKDNRIKIISQKNSGLSVARNVGIRAAKGDHIFLLDSDDWILENALKILFENIDNQDFIWFSGKVFFDDTKMEITDKPFSEPQMTGWDYYNKYALRPRRFHFVTTVLRLYKREFLLKNQLFFKEGIYHEDNLFTPVCCYYAKNVKVIPDILYVYRIREGSIMQISNSKRIYDNIVIANSLADFFISQENIDKSVIYREIAGLYFLSFMSHVKKQFKINNLKAKSQINWDYYKKVSIYPRHKRIYKLIKISPILFRIYIFIEKKIKEKYRIVKKSNINCN